MKIVTHPDNVALIQKLLDTPQGTMSFGPYAVEVVPSRYLNRERWAGRYLLPDGSCVRAGELRLPWGRFAEFGPEDARLLLYLGVIRKLLEPFYCVVHDEKFRVDTLNWMATQPFKLKAPFARGNPT